jgi:alpha-amylase
MKSICLCTKIHIPVIYQKQHFSDFNPDFKYFHIDNTKKHVTDLVRDKLLPYIEIIQKLSQQYGKNFKTGFSISGISVRLLEDFAPDVLEKIIKLSDDGTVDFFAEPYSHSILPYFNKTELELQTNKHKNVIQQIFKKEPLAFIAHSPVQSDNFMDFLSEKGYSTVFTYSNYALNKKWHLRSNGDGNHPKAVYYIHHALSEKFHNLILSQQLEKERNALTPFIRYTRKHASLVKPLVLLFDPLMKNISDYTNLEHLSALLLKKTGGSFYSLSDLAEISNYFAVENNFSNEMLSQFMLPNYWMKNNMQKEAFKQFQIIYEMIRQGDHPYLTEAWNFLQDLNNFFYMSDSFFVEMFEKQHFNPYHHPHEAFTNYMNAASMFWHMDRNHKKPKFMNNRFLIASRN